MVEAHAYGEVGSGGTGGVINILSNTMDGNRVYVYSEGDEPRSFLVFEPAHAQPIPAPTATTNTYFLLLFLS